MKTIGSLAFREVVLADFEFTAPTGEVPKVICLVAWELSSGRKWRVWWDDLIKMSSPPYPIGGDCLFVAYYASAELGCHLALKWDLPENILDLFTEFRLLTNGIPTMCGAGLLGALIHFGLNGIDADVKKSMQDLAIRGEPFTAEERQALLEYCETDAIALDQLLPKMENILDMPRALLRGRFMKAAARMENTGVPIDISSLKGLRENWSLIQDQLIKRIDSEYGVYEGRTFKIEKFENYLAGHGIPWPRLPSGSIATDDDTFKEMARSHPQIAPLRELRVSLSQMRLSDLSVGSDGRNRCLLSAFRSITGRNQPSNANFIFGTAKWLRGLIQPPPGFGAAYLDWGQQEFGIAAFLSKDQMMMEAYQSGDPYLAFAKQAGAIPPDGTAETHESTREQYKACSLAVLYGMGAPALAARISRPEIEARDLLEMYRRTYKTFWEWSDAAVDYAMLYGSLSTVFGWTTHVGFRSSRSLRNFPMQANGSEMLRLACCFATERGVSVCAPVHDAILIEAPLEQLESVVEMAKEAMADASAAVLNGYRLRTEAKLIRYPNRYEDKRGKKMWQEVWDLIEGRPRNPTPPDEQVHVQQ